VEQAQYEFRKKPIEKHGEIWGEYPKNHFRLPVQKFLSSQVQQFAFEWDMEIEFPKIRDNQKVLGSLELRFVQMNGGQDVVTQFSPIYLE
jgi:hypothetical protein